MSKLGAACSMRDIIIGVCAGTNPGIRHYRNRKRTDQMIIPDDLLQDIADRNLILFAGAGVSMNLGLPSWEELIDHISRDLGFDTVEFKKLGSFLELAEYYRLRKGSISDLISWMDTQFHPDGIDITTSPVHKAIVDIGFPVIYTTNYDRWLEKAHEAYGKPYDKIVDILDFTRTHPDRPQIVKYHGDFDNDQSIVLTETSYFKRLSLDTPLDMKLRADSLGKSLLFIGYSLSDIDIRFLLFKLQGLWEGCLERDDQPKSYIFLARDNPVQREILASRDIVTLLSEGTNPGRDLADFMRNLQKQSAAIS